MNFDDKRESLLAELQGENRYGIFLALQMGGVPQELQLIVQTAVFDEQEQGLRPQNQYVIRALGVVEHRVSLGVFGNLFIANEHPVLLHYNAPRAVIQFTGQPDDVNELVLDINQAYLSTFGPWRELAKDINRTQPLVNLLTSGSGVLGTMPKPGAERMTRVLAHHGMQATLDESRMYDEKDDHGRSTNMRLLGIDDSYLIALDFTVDELGKA
ncbi:MAG: hypothetical protein GC179_19660 [Anaerolineaceae bacterium]|nr:hypothetical protein [Anaerolineaceae bacterium]